MRILQVINSIAPRRGGPSYVVLRLARALAQRGLEVELISTRADLDEEGERQARAILDGIPLTLVPVRGPARVELAPGFVRALVPRARRADVVHVHTVWTYPVAVAPVVCRALSVPYLIRPAGTLDEACIESRSARKKRLALALVCRRNLERAAAVHVTSEHERRELARLVPRARLEVVEVGTDWPRTVRTDEGGPATRVGFLGRLHPKKGLEVLLDAVARLPGVTLDVAGGGEAGYEASLRERARASGVAERVRFLGHLDGAAKEAFLAGVDVLAFPSRDENFGVAVAEAMAAGRAVIVSPGVALSADIERSSTGLVAPADPAALAAALMGLLTDGRARARLAQSGRALAGERWRWEGIAERTARLYAHAAAR